MLKPRLFIGTRVMSSPFRRIRPLVASVSPKMRLRSVVFSAARRSENGDDLALLDSEFDVFENRVLAEGLFQVLQFQHVTLTKSCEGMLGKEHDGTVAP